MIIGVLAFQGDYVLHQKILNLLNVRNILVRNKAELFKTDALIIPGGESTVIYKLLYKNDMIKEILDYSKKHSIYGTCAGGILMSSKISDSIINPLEIVDVKVYRNA